MPRVGRPGVQQELARPARILDEMPLRVVQQELRVMALPPAVLVVLRLEGVHVTNVVETCGGFRCAVAIDDAYRGQRLVVATDLVVEATVRRWCRDVLG